jgi:putative PIN family toxin of toxin-antitoxin system
MRYLLDTNVLISAALFPGGVCGQVYDLAVASNTDLVVCDYTIIELKEAFARKFPERIAALEAFVGGIEPGVKIVPTPEAAPGGVDQTKVRDPKDWPILRAALAAHAAIVTGDKDLIDAVLPHPKRLTPAQFLARLRADGSPRD